MRQNKMLTSILALPTVQEISTGQYKLAELASTLVLPPQCPAFAGFELD